MSLVIRAHTSRAEETQRLAESMASELLDGDLLVLAGGLGAGKTCFTQGLGRGLGIQDRMTSPTFTLANHYVGRLELNHLDVYRIEQLADTMDLDLPELLEQGVTVIEWGEQILPALPADHLTIRLSMTDEDDERTIEFTADGNRWSSRWEELRQRIEPWMKPC